MYPHLSCVPCAQRGHPGAEHASEDGDAVERVVPHHVQRPIAPIPEIRHG